MPPSTKARKSRLENLKKAVERKRLLKEAARAESCYGMCKITQDKADVVAAYIAEKVAMALKEKREANADSEAGQANADDDIAAVLGADIANKVAVCVREAVDAESENRAELAP